MRCSTQQHAPKKHKILLLRFYSPSPTSQVHLPLACTPYFQPDTAVAPVAIPNKAKPSNASSQTKSQRTPTNPQFPPYNSDALFLRRTSC
jgi:hypothetical protein